ncbi:MAG TPA: hypothetical protein VE568_06450 [Rubrobacter sp.]|nr:hypothetical protein [Rubrobacter sp.]
MERVGMFGFSDDRHFAGEGGANYEADGQAPCVPTGGVTIDGVR